MGNEVTEQYTRWPYPDISLLASVPKEQLWQINVQWMRNRAGLAPEFRPRIWIAGCGTFQPYTFSQANPEASILATDVSKTSLQVAQRRCRLHLKRNIDFQTVDLESTQYPEETFDYIECYGVLMNLRNPGEVLKRLASRLKPNGMLRLMVYPHYGRQKIFQIQRLAKLLGLDHRQEKAPQKLKTFLAALPTDHPLRKAFFSYDDTRTESGIVDGFLHAGDRAFTGTEICQLIKNAGLSLSFTMHRPWGDPQGMAHELGLQGKDAAYLLNYLDVWQSLRSNFILCLTKKEASRSQSNSVSHPLFSFSTPGLGLKHRARLVRFALTGVQLQTRTYDGKKDLSSKEVRELLTGKPLDSEVTAPLEPLLSKESEAFQPSPHWLIRIGENAPNPLYAHEFDRAFFKEGRWETLGEDCSSDFAKLPTLPFAEAGSNLKTSQQREVFKFIDDQAIHRREWKKGELLELWCLLFNYQSKYWSV